MAAYGFQDIHFMLFPGTEAFCSHQVSLGWIFESSLSSHYPPLMRGCSRASGFMFRARLWCWCCCPLLKFMEPTVLVPLVSNLFVTLFQALSLMPNSCFSALSFLCFPTVQHFRSPVLHRSLLEFLLMGSFVSLQIKGRCFCNPIMEIQTC